jgi:phospholipase/carboxylesterase
MSSTYVYKTLLPSVIEDGKKYPVVFALHGIGYNEQHMLAVVEELKEEFILIGIRGDLPYEEGYAYYYLKEYGNPERKLFDDSIDKLKEFIEYTFQQYPIDSDRVYFIGFSQGAILSMTLALALGGYCERNGRHERIYTILCKGRISNKIYLSFIRVSNPRRIGFYLSITSGARKL